MKRIIFSLSIILASENVLGMVTANPEYNSQKKGKTYHKTLKKSYSWSAESFSDVYDYSETMDTPLKEEFLYDISALSLLDFINHQSELRIKELNRENAEMHREIEYLNKKLNQTTLEEKNRENCDRSSLHSRYYQNYEDIYTTSDLYQSCNSNNFPDNSQTSTSYENCWFPDLSIVNVNCLNKKLFKR